MKQPIFHYIHTQDTCLIELYANNELLAEWFCADSEYIEDEARNFQKIYNAGINFGLKEIKEKVQQMETDDATSCYIDGYADFQKGVVSAIEDFYYDKKNLEVGPTSAGI